MKIKVGDYINHHGTKCVVLAVHAAGTIDVQRADGRCFRISGLCNYR